MDLSEGLFIKNVPAFSASPGDTLAFDLSSPNDVPIQYTVEIASTTTNGGDIASGPFTKVASRTQLPANASGNNIKNDYELKWTFEQPFNFAGGGLIIRFSDPAGTFASDGNCTQVLTYGNSNDSSNYFVKRFYGDADGLSPYNGSDLGTIGGFKIQPGVPPNQPPTAPIDNDPAVNSVAEGAANGTPVGITAFSTDPNGQTPIYSLTNNAGGRFAINPTTGVVSVANSALLDGPGAHTIQVQASDGVGGTSSFAFVVNVNNVNPTAILNVANSIVYGNSLNVTLTGASDVSAADAASLHFAFGYSTTNSSPLLAVTYASSSTTASASLASLNSGSYWVFARVIDKDGGHSEYSKQVTVQKANATVTANNKTKTYGDANPVLDATVSGTVNGDVLDYTLATTAGQFSNVGDYGIAVTLGVNNNYSIAPTDGTLSIGQKAATVAANNKAKTYGDANPVLDATVSGTVNGDVLDYTLATTAGQFSNVGDYGIAVTLGVNNNYSITSTDGTLSIGQKAATVTANNKAKTYGDANPVLDATVSGTVNGDVLDYTLATTAGQFSNVGDYGITVTLASTATTALHPPTVRSRSVRRQPQLRPTTRPRPTAMPIQCWMQPLAAQSTVMCSTTLSPPQPASSAT